MKCNILLCTLGGSWAVIPEVYGFLAPNRLSLYRNHPDRDELARLRTELALEAADEVWVCTTQGRQTQSGVKSLLAWHALLPEPPALRLWQAEGTGQLANRQECDHLKELLLRACLLAHGCAEGGQVVLSLAGGRKTMSADLQWAGYLFGCRALIHVVGCEPLPEALTSKNVTAELFAASLPADLAAAILPLIVGQGQRSELLDVDLDGRGPVRSAHFPLPKPEPNAVLAWPAPADGWLKDELRQREQAGSQLLGNYLSELSRSERHENWRSLYRLPPRLIERLRTTPLSPEYRAWLHALPKADLHRHVGGCLDIGAQRDVGRAIWGDLTDTQRQQALRRVRSLLSEPRWPWDWPELLRRDRAQCAAALLVEASDDQLTANLFGTTEPRIALKRRHEQGFKAYERPGELTGSAVLGHPAAIEPYAAAIVRSAADEGLVYVELRGSPQKYRGNGLAFLQEFYQAIRGAAASLPEDTRPEFRFILIADRRQTGDLQRLIETAVGAKREMPEFIAGLDLAGDEAVAEPKEIAEKFLPAFEVCLPLTIHAGEGESADSIWQAAYHLHADRIGHGLSIGEHPRLAARFRDRGICLELCPSSNREVVGYRDPDFPDSAALPNYPLRALWEQGIPLTVCTDNPGISRTTLTDEYLTAARMLDGTLTCWDALAMIKQAFVHAFLPSSDKERLMKQTDASIYRCVLEHFSAM